MSIRVKRILFWILIVGIVGMAAVLLYNRQSNRDRVASLGDDAPLDSPTAATEPITLDLADDSTGAITATERQLALPAEVTARTRALLDHLNADYAQTGSAHPLPPGNMVDEIFLLPLPLVGHSADPTASTTPGETTSSIPVSPVGPGLLEPQSPGGELAVIDLRGAFVNAHPSGVEVESLTIASIIGTLHANIPQIEQVRFLVDGQPRETLAGHADLLRTYPSRDTTIAAAPAAPN
jgi:hypothetical protein